MIRERLARRPLALERLDCLCPGCRLLGRQLVLGRRRLQVLQLQFHLIEQPGLALRPAAVKLAPQLLDLQLEMGDQRIRRGVHRQCARRNGLGFSPRDALRQDHRMGGGKIGRKRVSSGFHKQDGITSTPSPK